MASRLSFVFASLLLYSYTFAGWLCIFTNESFCLTSSYRSLRKPRRGGPHATAQKSAVVSAATADSERTSSKDSCSSTMQLAAHVLRHTAEGDLDSALREFIAYSDANSLGMHLGTEKGSLIESAVFRSLPSFGPAVILETGCHAGDGTLSIVAALKERAGSIVVSAEANEDWLDGAKLIVPHATKLMNLSYLPVNLQDTSDFAKFLDSLSADQGIAQFDAIVFDHDEDFFLPHLQTILSKDFLRVGGTITVDNVKRKGGSTGMQLFMNFLAHPRSGFRTVVREIKKPYPDAVAIASFQGSPLQARRVD